MKYKELGKIIGMNKEIKKVALSFSWNKYFCCKIISTYFLKVKKDKTGIQINKSLN
jgi:hypothetical protein